MTKPVELNGIKTLVLQPQTVALVLDALAQLPYKVVHQALDEIIGQLRQQEKVDAGVDTGQAPQQIKSGADLLGLLGRNGSGDALCEQHIRD